MNPYNEYLHVDMEQMLKIFIKMKYLLMVCHYK